jgi:hypothetical protein
MTAISPRVGILSDSCSRGVSIPVRLKASATGLGSGRDSVCNLLIQLAPPTRQSEKNDRQFNECQLTLNQRVQGSSPCAPTNHFKGLAPPDASHSDKRTAGIPTNRPFSFFEAVAAARPFMERGSR